MRRSLALRHRLASSSFTARRHSRSLALCAQHHFQQDFSLGHQYQHHHRLVAVTTGGCGRTLSTASPLAATAVANAAAAAECAASQVSVTTTTATATNMAMSKKEKKKQKKIQKQQQQKNGSDAPQSTLDKVMHLAKSRGFLFATSEIYGGVPSSFDYGPLGVALHRHITQTWWHDFVQSRPECVGVDSAVIQHTDVWAAAGHLDAFIDPLVECRRCHARHRTDHLLEAAGVPPAEIAPPSSPSAASSETSQQQWLAHMDARLRELKIGCPACGANDTNIDTTAAEAANADTNADDSGTTTTTTTTPTPTLTNTRVFNLMFATTTGRHTTSYLRPETAQGAFINMPPVLASRSGGQSLPFGVGQIGKSFRNEIRPGHAIFRVREFTQMELQYFVRPRDAARVLDEWVARVGRWLRRHGLQRRQLRRRIHGDDERAHYALASVDWEYRYPFGWGELWGVANRGDYDLRQHAAHSRTHDMLYTETAAAAAAAGESDGGGGMHKFHPYVIEPSVSVERLVLALLCDAYDEEVVSPSTSRPNDGRPRKDDVRTVLRLHPALAPIHYAVLPLQKNSAPLLAMARELAATLRRDAMAPSALYDAASDEDVADDDAGVDLDGDNATTTTPTLATSATRVWRLQRSRLAAVVEYNDTGNIGKRYRRYDEIGTPYCVTVDFDSIDDACVTVRDRDTMAQVRVPAKELVTLACERGDLASLFSPQRQQKQKQ